MLQESTTIERLRQVRNVTRNYHTLRGLQGVPFGILFLIIAVFAFGWVPFADLWLNVELPALFIGGCVALILYPLIGDYYDRMFGAVKQVSNNKLDTAITTLAVLVLLLVGIRMDNSWNLPVSGTGLALAAWFLLCWWQTNSFRTHLLIIGGVIAFLSLLPLVGFSSLRTLFLPTSGGYYLAFGLLMTIGGICDHLLLIHTFRRTQRAYHD